MSERAGAQAVAASKKFGDLVADAQQQTGPRPTPVHFPPLLNGLDYVDSVIELLEGQPSPRDLKYAVLHLHAAVEVLVKVRLERHKPTLLFAESEVVDLARLRTGNFKSVDGGVAIRLLTQEGLPVPARLKNQYEKLAKARNQLQHYGMPQSSVAIEGRVGQVFASLLEFLPSLDTGGKDPADDQALADCQKSITATLRRLNAVLDAHLRQAESELDALATANVGVVTCPDCDRVSLVIQGQNRKECLCCLRSWPWDAGDELADDYASEVVGITWHEVQQGADQPVRECVECDATAFVGEVKLRGHDEEVWLCFNCGEWAEAARIDSCSWCGRPILDSHENGLLCHDCYPSVLASWD